MIHSPMFPYLPTTYEVTGIVTTETEIVVQAQSRRTSACCPHCGLPSHGVHSYYQRSLWEQPTAGRPVHLRVVVHRCRCRNRACEAATLAEPLSDLAERFARRTSAQEQAIQRVGLALGGRAGARVAVCLGLAGASPSTLLRHIRRVVLPEPTAVKVSGIDDWLWRKPDRFGAIVVDLQRHQVVDLLTEYSKEALTAWLRQHPDLEIVVSDRSKIGQAACRQGAPQALQVADRFHLLKNLTDQLAAGFSRHPTRPPRPPPPSPATPSAEAKSLTPKEQGYAQMQALRASGNSIRAIARHLGYARATGHGWLTQGPPQAAWVGQVRRSTGQPPQPSPPPTSPRAAAFLFARLPEELEPRQRAQLRQVLVNRPELEPIYQLAQGFVHLLKQRDLQALESWLAQASACCWSQLRSLARGLRADLAAVQAALTSPYSNGLVEGLITRLKLLKRQGYGRASVELLRYRLVAAA
jgi:transposase